MFVAGIAPVVTAFARACSTFFKMDVTVGMIKHGSKKRRHWTMLYIPKMERQKMSNSTTPMFLNEAKVIGNEC